MRALWLMAIFLVLAGCDGAPALAEAELAPTALAPAALALEPAPPAKASARR